MACKKPALSANIVICLGLFIVSTSFCHGKGLTKLKALDKPMGNHTLDRVQSESRELHHGRLLIGKNQSEIVENLPEVDKDFQADMGWEEPRQPKGQIHGFSEQKQDNSAVEQLLKMEPKVECTKDSMKLQVQDAASYPGSLLFVDRGSRLSPLPLNKLPPSCGYSIQSTMRDLVLVAPYDGCFVSRQEDTYVLPLRWWGLPVRMSCPLMRQSSPNPPLVTCHTEGMIVKTEWAMSTDKIKVKLSGDWKPLMTASSTCRFGVVAHPEGVVISVHFAPCLQETDGMYTLELAGDGEIKISCPSLPPAGTEQTKDPVKNLHKEVPIKGMHPPAQSEENHTPQTIDQPQNPYFPSYPNYFLPVNPGSEHTEKPVSPPETGKNVGKPQQPVDPPVKQPVPPKGQDQQSIFQYPYYPLPHPASKPSQSQAPKGQVQQSFVTQPEPEKPAAAQKPSQPTAPKGQVYQPYPFYIYPYYSQPEPENKPALEPTPTPEPEAPQSQVNQQIYHFPSYPQPEAEKHPEKPSSAAKPQQPETPEGQGQGHQQLYLYPYYFYSGQNSKNPAAVKPLQAPQPEAPKGQAQWPIFPKQDREEPPAKNPAVVQKPSQPEAPQSQVYPKQVPDKQPAAEKPAQPQVPQSPVYPSYYHPYFFHQPKPKNPPAEKPTGAAETSQPSKPAVTQSQVPGKQPAAEKPAQPQVPQSPVYPSYYHPYFFHQPKPKNPPAEKPSGAAETSQPSKPAVTQSQVPGKQQAAEKPAQPQVPQSPVYPSYYHPYFFHQPKPKNPPAEKPTGAAETSQPSKPAITQSYENQFAGYQYPLYPMPDFGKQPATWPKQPPHQKEPGSDVQQSKPQNLPDEKATSASNQQPEVPHFPQYKPFYPYHYPYGYPYSYPFYSQPGPSDQQTAVPKPGGQSSKTEGASTDDNTSPVKNHQQPQYPKYVTLPPVTAIKHPHQASSLPSIPDNQQPSKGGTDPQTLPHKPPVYCPQYCPSGLSSCCVQIAFHQHLHHILPAKETPQLYPGLPFLPSMFYTGSDQGLVSASPASTSASVASQSLTVKGNQQYHQPPDGNLDALKGSNPIKPTNQKQIHILPHPVNPYQAYPPQHEGLNKFPQSQLPAHYKVPSNSQALSKSQVNQVVQHPVTNTKIVTTEQRPSDIKSSDSGAKHPNVIGDPNHHRLLQYLFQNSQGLTDHSHSLQPKPSGRTLQEPNHQPANNANPEPQSFVLLQHGPPGRESHGINGSPLPSTDLIHDAHHQIYELQYPQTPQHPNWLEEELSNSSPENSHYMPRSGDEPGPSWRSSAPTGPHFVPLSQDPSFSADTLKPQFSDLWEPMAPGSSGQKVPSFVHPEAYQQQSPAADEPQNGFYQPSDEEGGTQK